MYEDENNLYHYSYRKGDEQNPDAPIDTKNYAEDPWDKNPGGKPRRKRAAAVFPARSWRWRWCARSSAASSAQA